ncbi:MAG: FAD-dependent oxidoreductase [Acidobacteriota bacterium]
MSHRVAILGGGPAGATTALVLARRGLEVVVLERAAVPAAKPGECLPPQLVPLLDHLRLRDHLLTEAHRPSHGNRSSWGDAAAVEEDFLFSGYGPGFHVDRQRFEHGLADSARRAGVDWRCGVRVTSGRRTARGWTLTFHEGSEPHELTADFVVDASGRQAALAHRLGHRRIRHDRLVGVTTILEGRAIDDSFTSIEAVESGWWYTAPLNGGRLAVAYMTDSDLVNASGTKRRSGWHRQVARLALTAERIEDCVGDLGALEDAPTLRVLPAESSRMETISGDGWLAVGDAAVSYDPLSSYGVLSAMASGYYAAHAIFDHLRGRAHALLAYVHILEKNFQRYWRLLHEAYAREQRWVGAPFWRRRHQVTIGTAHAPGTTAPFLSEAS